VRRIAAAAGLFAMALGPSLPPRGPVLLDVVLPAPGLRVGHGGFELLVRFREGVAVPETFRATLNGSDVTDELITGDNGSHGRLVALLPGANRLRLVISGHLPWSEDDLFEQSHEVQIWMQPRLDLDRG
jgi:hypothetical protein